MVCVLALLVTLLVASSASALSQRGHIFGGSFNIEASGGVPLKDPTGVAVNESTGDIFVVDSGNNRIVEFDSKHHFVKTWGFGVKDGEKKFETCTSDCLAGIPGRSRGQMHGPDEIAIDNNTNTEEDPSAGDIYVETVSPYDEELPGGGEREYEYYVIEKFGPEGELLKKGARIKGYKEPESSIEPFEEEEFHGFTIGADGKLYVYYEEAVLEYTNGVTNKFIAKVETEAEANEGARSGVAVDTTGKTFYIAHESEEGEEGERGTIFAKMLRTEETPGEPFGRQLFPALSGGENVGIATDYANNDEIVDNVNTIAVFGPESEANEPIERLGQGEIHSGTGVAAPGNGDIFVADAGSNEIDFFDPEPAGAPAIDAVSVDKVTQESAELKAQVDPTGLATTYEFRYSTGAVPKAGEACTGACVELPSPAAELTAGFEDDEVSQSIEGLTPGTAYHWRIIVFNAGAPSGVESSEHTFHTELVSSVVLPDGRSWEVVSPLDKNGASIEAQTREGGLIESSESGERLTYVAIGSFPGAEGNRAPEASQIIAVRGTKEWSNSDVDPKEVTGLGVSPGAPLAFRFFNPELTQSILEPYGQEQYERLALDEEVPAGETPKHESTPYLRLIESASCRTAPAPYSCFDPLLTPEKNGQGNVPAEAEVNGQKVANHVGGRIEFIDSTPDMRHMILQSDFANAVLSDEPSGEAGLYEWNEGKNVLVSVLPEGKPATVAALGLINRNYENALSSDGSRVVFSTASELGAKPEHLYLRDVPKGETVQLDKPEPGAEETPANSEPDFQAANANDSQIFFTDEQRLTTNSTASAEKHQPDLYDCLIRENEETGNLECKLTDLSVDPNAGESAAVQGLIPGTGRSGETAYFVADGALAPGATPGTCQTRTEEEGEQRHTETCSLYVDHFDAATESWEAPKFIATLSEEDEPDWRATRGPKSRAEDTSKVSEDGNLLSFVSDRPLTGYDNKDVHSGKPDTEVFLYDASTEHLSCISCNPLGDRPTGVFDTQNAGEGRGLLVDRPLTWEQRWISGTVPSWTALGVLVAPYQSRYLFNDGRMFFTSSEALVPQDKNGKEDVYEYEPPGVGGCTTESETYGEASGGCVSLISSGTSTHESAFLDASASGNDVFFLTAEKLVPADTDTYYDVYDATVCGQEGSHACLETPAESAPPCESEEKCRLSSTETGPQFAKPGSIAPNGSTNSSSIEVLGTKSSKPTSAQSLSKELAKCRKDKSKSKRASCEKSATLKYGTKAEKLNVSLKACHNDKKRKTRLACEKLARKKYGAAKKAAHGARRAGR